jgi:hypothetical protein
VATQVSSQSSALAYSSSAATLSAPGAVSAKPKEPAIQYEPHTKPAKTAVATSSSTTSAAVTVPPVSSSAPPIAKPVSPAAAAPVTSGPAKLVYAECPICYDQFPDCGIIPCGHTFCLTCSKSLSLCSICRQPIQGWLRFYLSQGVHD